MKRSKSYLDNIKHIIEFSHSGGYGGSLDINSRVIFDPHYISLGYCYKYINNLNNKLIYKISTSPIGIEDTDYRILLHEFGHIYLKHLDYDEEYNKLLDDAVTNNRENLIKYVNNSCNIDWGEEFIDRLLNDKGLKHEIHNIAMDLEVNSKVLSLDDINEMEADISSKLPDYEKQAMIELSKTTKDQATKKQIDDYLKDSEKNSKIKLMHPNRFHYPDGTPWEDELSYPEYLVLMVTYPDQYIKMMASVASGKNGDTSDVTDEDMKNAMSDKNGDKNGNGKGNNPLDNLRKNSTLGSGDGDFEDGSGKDGTGPEDQKGNWETSSHDHSSPEREMSENTTGGSGRGATGHNGALTAVSENDKVDMALGEIIRHIRKRVDKIKYKIDNMYIYNRGINRSVILPTMRSKHRYDVNLKIVFLIDVSGSMPSSLVSRFITTINSHLSKINGGLKYDLIYWDTHLCKHYKDLDPKKPIPPLYSGGGTDIAKGIKFFHDNYKEDTVLVIASDFEDSLDAWHAEESKMKGYDMFGLDYGNYNYSVEFTNLQVRKIPYNRYDN